MILFPALYRCQAQENNREGRRCIHCAQCVDSCPTDAMQMDQRFEIAAFDRHDLKMAWEFVRAVVKIKPQA
ncbi:MAG: 4Fe-4S dicluster domain-containing protein [Candidatus Aminicenantales bacterium]